MKNFYLRVLGLWFLSSTLLAAQPAWPTLTFTRVAQGIQSPTHITNAGDGSARLFFLQQNGVILVRQPNGGTTTPFLDLSDRTLFSNEQGLLSMAFPPNYSAKKYFYVYYSRKPDGAAVISRLRVPTATPDVANLASEEVILTVPQPYSNHNGGQLAFGPDGFLYIGKGDGGGGGDPENRAQNPASLLGKILRIDVEGSASPYGIPPNNPFVGNSAYRPEIWALGLRNPFRFSFDRLNGDLYIADVGQNAWEEVDYQVAGSPGGANYGWRVREGNHDYNVPSGFNLNSLTPPIVEYDHSVGESVTGGFVVRSGGISPINGLYIYGDFISGKVFGLARSGNQTFSRKLAETSYGISTFGEDEAGQLYLADYFTGDIYRVQASGVVSSQIRVTANPVKGGTATGAGTYASGTPTKLTAKPKSGYAFKQWTENGNVVSTNKNYNFTVGRSRNLVAQFIKK